MKSFSVALMVRRWVAMLALVACSSGGAGASLQDPPVDDAAAAEFIQTDLQGDVGMAGCHVEVKIEKGVAILTGKAESLAQAERAGARAVADGRVRVVVNQIDVEAGNDAEVSREVRAALKQQTMIDASGLAVTVKHGRVTLGGKVGVWDELGLARELTSGVPGVVAVRTDVVVTYEGVRSDSQIAAQLKFLIKNDPLYAGLHLGVTVKEGTVSLNGEVGGRGEFDRLVRRCYVTGVVDVQLSGLSIDSQLVMEGLGDREYSADEVLSALKEGWALDERVDGTSIRPVLKDGVLRLQGYVGSEGEKEAAESVARSIPGLIRVENELRIGRGAAAGMRMAAPTTVSQRR